MKAPTTTRTRTKPEQSAIHATLTRPINVSLTGDERDAIDAAKGRARRLLSLASAVMDGDSILEDDTPIAELLEVIGESLKRLDATFEAADARTATAGGAR